MGNAASSGVQDTLAASHPSQVRVLAQAPGHDSLRIGRIDELLRRRPPKRLKLPPRAHLKRRQPRRRPRPRPPRRESRIPVQRRRIRTRQEHRRTAAHQAPARQACVRDLLSNQPYAAVFGPASTSPYLSGTLEKKGELLVDYDAVAHEELPNEVALISGQGPTVETAANCPTYTEIASTGTGEDEQVLGAGCVYPKSTPTLPGQLASKHLTWRAYVQGIDEAGSPAGACAHPALGQADPTSGQAPGSGTYSTFRNPFVYFASITRLALVRRRRRRPVGALAATSRSAKATPNFSYIVPDRCHDGNPTPCAPGAKAGLGASEAFLKTVVPQITASKAFKQDGLLVITVDQAPSSGEFADSSSCCSQPQFPNMPAKTTSLTPRAAAPWGHCCSRHRSRAAPPTRNRSTTSRCCGRSRSCSACARSATRSCAGKPLPPSMFIAKGSAGRQRARRTSRRSRCAEARQRTLEGDHPARVREGRQGARRGEACSQAAWRRRAGAGEISPPSCPAAARLQRRAPAGPAPPGARRGGANAQQVRPPLEAHASASAGRRCRRRPGATKPCGSMPASFSTRQPAWTARRVSSSEADELAAAVTRARRACAAAAPARASRSAGSRAGRSRRPRAGARRASRPCRRPLADRVHVAGRDHEQRRAVDAVVEQPVADQRAALEGRRLDAVHARLRSCPARWDAGAGRRPGPAPSYQRRQCRGLSRRPSEEPRSSRSSGRAATCGRFPRPPSARRCARR